MHYLTHGEYPPGHWRIRRTRNSSADIGAVAEPGPISRLEQKPPQPPTPRLPDGLTPTRKLLKDIIDAGGILERDIRDDKTSYRSLVGIINRKKMAPDGQEVTMLSGVVDMSLNQMGPSRPTAALVGYRTPIPGLWHTGAGAHPVGGVCDWAGRTTARTVLNPYGRS